jgi:hypothetical protein
MTQKNQKIWFDFGNANQSIFISGSGRSGTTWLQEIINYDNQYRVLFEPFHKQKVPILQDWYYRQYIRSESREKKFINPARKILSGKIRNAWIDKDNTKIIANKRIIKDIRTQFLLKWVKSMFPKIPIIMIMRHPCAVAQSKLALGWNSELDQHVQELFLQKDLVQDYLSPYFGLINTIKDDFEKHILLWCLEYYVPLMQFQEGEILVLFYENLCVNYNHEIERLFSFLGFRFSEKIYSKHKTPSSQAMANSAIVQGKNPINAWRKNVSKQQIHAAISILNYFNLDAVYNENDMPIIEPEVAWSIFP